MEEQTPCQLFGYKVGDKFKVIYNEYSNMECSNLHLDEILTLRRDDGTDFPYFSRDNEHENEYPINLSRLKKIDTTSCPKHYNYAIQPWEYMESVFTENEYRGYLRGNIIKYISRYPEKGGVVDLEKAKHYLEELIKWEQN